MKKLILLSLMIALFASQALASVRVYEDGANEGDAKSINLSTGLNGSFSDGKYNITADPVDITSAVFEGTTADAYETTLAVVDPTADQTATIPNATGNIVLNGSTVALTPGAAVTLTVVPGTNKTYTDTIVTDNQDQTITFSSAGNDRDIVRIIFQTDSGGSNDEVITFHTTLTNSAGTLTLANLTAGRYVVSFQSDGTVWNEISRTAALS